MEKVFETRYYVNHGDIKAVEVCRVERDDGRIVWNERGGAHTYADRHIRGADELTTGQKRYIVHCKYDREIRAIEWDIAKDPTLAGMRRKWRKAARDKRDAALAEIGL